MEKFFRGVSIIYVLALVFMLVGCTYSPIEDVVPDSKPEHDEEEKEYEPDFPIEFHGTYFTWGDETIEINEKNIFIDGRLSNEDILANANVYNSFKEATSHLVSGTEDEPMNVWIAPYVYWTHDPDSPSTTDAYQITISNIKNLHLTGLTNNPNNVVIAMNYGHNEGLDGGNPTMLNISGDGLTLKNITFGGYCNIDLDYPLDPSLSRQKRTDNVTQCQIASYSGDKLYAENCRFVSRLNMMPFNNSKRALYVDCHFESTDDSLNGSSQAVYLNCDFDFYASKPWGGSSGVTLLNCVLRSKQTNTTSKSFQYLSKGGGSFVLVDCDYRSSYPAEISYGFSDVNSSLYKAYTSNVTLNGKPLHMRELHSENPAADITGTELLDNWKLVDGNGNAIYNIWNLLGGSDGWDPLNQKEIVEALHPETYIPRSGFKPYFSKASSWGGTSYVTEKALTMFSGETATISVDGASGSLTYTISNIDNEFVELSPSDDTTSCVVSLKDESITTQKSVFITVRSKKGQEALVLITVKPHERKAPDILNALISQNDDGTASLSYNIDFNEDGILDESLISWSVADDQAGTNEIALTPERAQLKKVTLNPGCVGKYLIAKVTPKSSVSAKGDVVRVVMENAISSSGLSETKLIRTDFSDIPLSNHAIKEGFWTTKGYIPKDTQSGYIPLDGTEVSTKYSAKVSNWNSTSDDSWSFGIGGKNGFLNYQGIYYKTRGANIFYTPVGSTFGDMDLTVKMAPGKTASQGFGSDYQYMDILIKYDAVAKTGFGLRIYRQSGSSCSFVLMEYKDEFSKEISEPITSAVFLTEMTAHVWTDNNTLHAECYTSNEAHKGEKVELSAPIVSNTLGSFGIQTTGTTGDNTVYLGALECSWK